MSARRSAARVEAARRRPSRSGRLSNGPRDARRSSTPLGCACSPRLDSLPPSAPSRRRISVSTPRRLAQRRGVRPLPGDELPMPAKQRVRRHDGRDLPQPSTAQPIRAHGESAPIVVGQLQASAPQLAAKHTILFKQITKDISFLAIQPPGEEREQQLERGDVDHGRSLYHGPQILPSPVDPVMGHFYEAARQVTPLVVAFSVIADRPPVSAHSPSTSQGMCARTGFVVLPRRQATDLARSFTLLSALCMARLRAGARYDPTEASRTLRDGSRLRPHVLIALTPPA